MTGETATLLDWGNRNLHLLDPDWRPGERPRNACGARPAAFKPKIVYWMVKPRAARDEMCGRCTRRMLGNTAG